MLHRTAGKPAALSKVKGLMHNNAAPKNKVMNSALLYKLFVYIKATYRYELLGQSSDMEDALRSLHTK